MNQPQKSTETCEFRNYNDTATCHIVGTQSSDAGIISVCVLSEDQRAPNDQYRVTPKPSNIPDSAIDLEQLARL
jgi:hypothetical protein